MGAGLEGDYGVELQGRSSGHIGTCFTWIWERTTNMIANMVSDSHYGCEYSIR